MWQGIQLNLSQLLTHFWPGQVRNRQLCNSTHTRTHTLTRACTQTHSHMQMHLNTQTHAMPKWAHMHARVDTAAPWLWPAEIPRVCVYSHFPHLAFLSCHIAIVLLPLTPLIDFLFLWAVANVTFPAGAHTLMLSTASHPGYKNTGSSPGVSRMEKKCPSLHVTCSYSTKTQTGALPQVEWQVRTIEEMLWFTQLHGIKRTNTGRSDFTD